MDVEQIDLCDSYIYLSLDRDELLYTTQISHYKDSTRKIISTVYITGYSLYKPEHPHN